MELAGSQRGLTTPLLVGSHRSRVLLGMPSLSRSAAVAAATTTAAGSPVGGVTPSPMLPPGGWVVWDWAEGAEGSLRLLSLARQHRGFPEAYAQ